MSEDKKVALVTGASRGIGRAIAVRLVQDGFTVIGTATTEAGAGKITEALSALDPSSCGMVLNVAKQESIDELMSALKEGVGMPSVLVNNAAITKDNLFLRMKQEEWDPVIDTNLSSVFRMCKACFRPMMKARWGRIVNITSVVGLTGNFGQANYSAAKAGVIGLTKTLGQELAPYSVTVNAVAPGFVETDMTNEIPEKQTEAMLAQIPLARKGQPEDIAAGVSYLVSDGASYVTGETLNINGGLNMA